MTLDALLQELHLLGERRGEDVLLAREAAVHRAERHVGLGGEVPEAHGLEAVALGELHRHAYDAVTAFVELFHGA